MTTTAAFLAGLIAAFSRFGTAPTIEEAIRHCLRGVQEDEHIYVLLLACFASALFTGMFCGTILANVREQAERC